MAFVALLFTSISPIVAHEAPLLTMTNVKYSCVNINGQFKPVLYVTLDNLSFSFFGMVAWHMFQRSSPRTQPTHPRRLKPPMLS